MKPPRTRLTCRAHNCYSPSIALWEHFFGTTNRPLPCYQRLASTIAEITRDGTEGDAQLEPDNALEEHDQHIAPAPQVRRMTTVKGTWRPSKVDASIARNLQYVYATRQSSMNDVEPDQPSRTAETTKARWCSLYSTRRLSKRVRCRGAFLKRI
jgi:non-canonical poly(A) RNA polymerase PAPD5/7